ncbi:MAG: helix-turn-helix transcriptional regulator [Breznakibacter sp.]
MERLTSKILHSNYFVWPVIIVTAMVAGIAVYFAGIREKVIFPNPENYRCDHYTDAANGGNTQVTTYSATDSAITFGFKLGDSFYSPYAGLSITPTGSKTIDATKYNQLSIQIMGRHIDRVGISIFTPGPPDDSNGKQDEALYHSYLNISNRKEIYHIPIRQFQHPEWWEDLHHISKNKKNEPDLGQILHVNIGSAFTSIADKQKTLEIYSIAFSRNNRVLYWWLGTIYVFIVSLLLGIHLLVRMWHNEKAEITVSYKPLEIEHLPKPEDKCLEYIHIHYHDSNLTLEKISEKTGTMPRRITQTIHDRFNCNFKTHLNRIRINESKRLLEQTDLNIGEIAYKVGFNNQSHFNRVFKSEFSISPSEYRDAYKP